MAIELEKMKMDEELIEAFKLFGPSDADQGISIKQLGDTLEKGEEPLSPADLKILFEETDSDHDGLIGMRDFMLMMMAK